MQILCIDFDSPFSPYPGGQFECTRQTIFPLSQEHEVTILTAGPVPTQHSYPVRYIGTSIGFGRQFDFIHQARQYVRAHSEYDVILEKFTSPIGPIGLPHITDIPVIGIANFMFWDEMSQKYHLPFGMVARTILKQYRHLICFEQDQIAKLKKLSPQSEVVALPPIAAFPVQQSSTIGDTILFIGRPDIHQKGLDLLGHILTEVELPDAKVTIAGGTTHLPNYQGSLPIDYVGYLTNEQKAKAYRSARFLVLPSRYESFGLVQLEAASFGKPTVAFNLPVFRSRQSAMLLGKPMNTHEFAQAIINLWNDGELLNRLSQQSIRLSKKHAGENLRVLNRMIKQIVLQ